MADPKNEARVLVDHGDHKCNDILTGADAQAAIAAGLADGSPAAVAYAKKEARKAARTADGE